MINCNKKKTEHFFILTVERVKKFIIIFILIFIKIDYFLVSGSPLKCSLTKKKGNELGEILRKEFFDELYKKYFKVCLLGVPL